MRFYTEQPADSCGCGVECLREMRSTRDLLRRRLYFVDKRAELP